MLNQVGSISMSASHRVAVLLSTRYFEDFYGHSLGLTRNQYIQSYRNDWSWGWCRMLERQGVHTNIYVATTQHGELVTTPDGYDVRFLRLRCLAAPWVKFPVLERSPAGRYVGQAANAAALLKPLRSALVKDEIDLLCIQEYWTARFDLLVRTIDCPIVALGQGLPDRHEIKFAKRGSFRRCSGAIVQTDSEREKIARYGGASERIPNAVDADLFSPDPGRGKTDTCVILCVGRLLDMQKRLSDVIRALALLPSEYTLEIAGTGPDRSRFEQLAADLGVSARITFHGFVSSGTRLRDLYRRASVLALPSAYEGLPMVLLEAMSCGTAVVGTDIAAIAEVIEHGSTGLLVPVGAPERLAAALRETIERRDELGAAAREAILATYDQSVVGPRLAAALRFPTR